MLYPMVSVPNAFMDNFYSFHRMVLKLGGQLDPEMIQRILFQGYSTPNFVRVIMLLL